MKVGRLGDIEAMRFVYENFGKKEKTIPTNALKDSVHHDMETFCGGDRSTLEHHLFRALNNTRTKAGAVQLQRILAEPSDNVAELTKRQNIVRKLIEDEDLFNNIDASLKTYKKAENETLWFWKEMDPATSEYFNQAYWQNFLLKNYRTDSNILELDALYANIVAPAFPALVPVLSGMAQGLIVTTITKMTTNNLGLTDKDEIKKTFAAGVREVTYQIYPGCTISGEMKVPDTNEMNSVWAYTKHHLKKEFNQTKAAITGSAEFDHHGATVTFKPDSTFRFVIGLINALVYGKIAYSLANSVKSAIDFNATVNEMQKRLINFGTVCTESYKLAHLVKSANLTEEISTTQAVAQTFSASSNDQIGSELANTLTTNTFKGEPSMFSHQGRILAAFEIIKSSRDHFIGMMKAVGELDAYMSIAKLYKKHANHPNATFCFPEFVTDSSVPYVNIQEFWHPILNPETVVTNSLELGGVANKARNFIITGPNAGGKSTVLKSVTLAIILAQTFGIAPASAMKITPFGLFNTYMNIADTEGKASLFQAEMHRAQDLLVEVMQLNSKKFSFTVMDEIFTGTNPKEGMAAAYGIAKKLSTYKNSMNLIATHFMVLTELEAETNGLFTNKKVRINRDEAGMIKYPYKLEDGITNQAIALELLEQEGFDSDILKDAYSVMDRKAKKYEQVSAVA